MWERGLIQTLHFEPQPHVLDFCFLRKPHKKVELIGFKQTISVSSEVSLSRWHFKHKLFLRQPLHCPNTHAELFWVPKLTPTETDRV